MNRRIIVMLALCAAILLILPTVSMAGDTGSGYATVKLGAFFPTGDLDDEGFDTGFNADLVLGNRYARNLSLEFGIGYFQSDSSTNTAELSTDDDLWVIPLYITAKGVIPFEKGEVFAGGGIGMYFVEVDSSGFSTTAGFFDGSDDDQVVGIHFVAGGSIDITPKVSLGVEGKYIATDDIQLYSSEVNIEGISLTGNIGYRF